MHRAVTARHASGPNDARTCREGRGDHIAAAELAAFGSPCCFPSARVALAQWLGTGSPACPLPVTKAAAARPRMHGRSYRDGASFGAKLTGRYGLELIVFVF